jgi:peptidoglycan/LPS O-acetylase OafA/YrhL
MDAFVVGGFFQMLYRKGIKIRRWYLLSMLVIWLLTGYLSVGFKPSSIIMQTLGFTSSSIFFGLIIHYAAERNSLLLSAKWLRFFGKYSYSIYLFHVPALLFLEDYIIGDLTFGNELILFVGMCFASTLLLALISWHLVEKPFLSFKSRFLYT